MTTRAVDMTGKTFGSLTAIKPVGVSKARNITWLFSCDCGNERIADGYDVRSGKYKSCLQCAKASSRLGTLVHGKTETTEFSIWTGILTRCYNKNCKAYKNYGGRGIKVCERWRFSFENFLLDMGARPSKGHSIDRENNDGDYSPENCRWATSEEQGNNKRSNIRFEVNGVTKSAKEWAKDTGVSYLTILSRYHKGKRGDDLVRPSKRLGTIEFGGITDTLCGWGKRTGLKPSTIAMRISRYGWSIEKSLSNIAGEKL